MMQCLAFFLALAFPQVGHGFVAFWHRSYDDVALAGQIMSRADDKDLGDAPSWTLQNMTRRLPKTNEIWMGFHITSEGYHPEPCYMLIHVKDDPKGTSFSNERCVGSNFTVSWGHSEENDAGILTLVNPNKTRRSWFGWNHVNDSVHLEDVGPNATKEIPS